MTTVWSPLEYGWNVVYWLQIEGIPIVWTEYATGKTLPSGATSEDASLVIDDSGAVGTRVDRFEGVGKSLPLSFRLRDTSTVRTWLKRWSTETPITTDHTSSVTTLTVADTTGFASSGSVYIGNERITYSGTTATTFTGCTRGTVGYAYPHKAGSVSGAVTDLPRYWRGREVKLWATPVDPTGYIPGSTIDEDAELIWRGHIDEGPQRVGLHFEFTALALDRRLGRKIGAKWSGVVADKQNRYRVSEGDLCRVHIIIHDNAGAASFNQDIQWQPFSSKSDGEMLTGSEMRALIKSTFETQLTNLAITEVTSLRWVGDYVGGTKAAAGYWRYRASFVFAADANARQVYVRVRPFGHLFLPGMQRTVASLSAGDAIESYWWTYDDPKTQNGQPVPHTSYSLSVLLTDGLAADLPQNGYVIVDKVTMEFRKSETVGGIAYLSQIEGNLSGMADYHKVKPGAEVVIVPVTNLTSAPITTGEAIARTLAASGESALRNSTYDTLDAGQGYGLDDDQVDYTQIVDHLKVGMLAEISLSCAFDDQSFADVFAGVLALSGNAIVMRPDDSDGRKVKLMAVSLGNGAGYATTIADADLLTRGAEPVRAEPWEPKPNHIEVIAEHLGEPVLSLSVTDYPAVQAQGRQSLEFPIPVAGTKGLQDKVTIWAVGILGGAPHGQSITVMVPPWTAAEVGDVVKLNTTHPGIWDWSTGAPGYTSVMRVVGRETRLQNGVTTLHLIESEGGALCPSAAIVGTDNTTAPTYIDVGIQYLDHFSDAISAAGGNIRVLHYRPGAAEGVSEGYNISAAAANAGNCRLTVDSLVGTPTIVTTPNATDDSHLTLPESANDDTFQAQFMHKSDGTKFA